MRLLRGLGTLIKAILISIGALYLIVTWTTLDRWWVNRLAGRWSSPKGDILIVLGADVVDTDDMIGLTSYWRSVYAVRAWRGGEFRRMIIAGGPPGPRSISAPMREFAACLGVPAEALSVEDRSRSTRENALFTRDTLANQAGRKVLLTSDYHMYRAARAFRKAGLDVEPQPIPDGLKLAERWESRWPLFIGLVQETAKIGYYKIRGWI